MKYPISIEILGKPSLKLDGETQHQQDIEKISFLISNFTGIEQAKIVYFINNFGINKIFSEPSIMGIPKDKEDTLLELKELLEFGEDKYGTDDDVKSI